MVESEPDTTRWATADSKTDISNFFERPVEIQSYTWSVGGNLDAKFNPWQDWISNSRVSNRLNNFGCFRGTLHLKYVLNGNNFYWGRAFASYTPHVPSKTIVYDNSFLTIMPATQRPHMWIDPTTSQGGEMVLPFFYWDDALNLSVNDGAALGHVWLKSLAPLWHTNGNTQGVTLTVYAWMTDVELTAPTNSNMASLSPQASDEYGMGIVSRPANVVAAVAKKLSEAPVIGPYAMATSMAGSAIANIAAMFGYSRPRQLEATKGVRIKPVSDLASTDITDTTTTLALTGKHEVTIDPRTTGLAGQDEMDFSYLMSKPCYYAKADWSFADTKLSTLFSTRVNPLMYNVDVLDLGTFNQGYALTTTAMAALPFKYWKGSMTYRFQIVGSGYHKGRLLAVWDPVVAATTPETNTAYSKVIDIAEERDFAITIGWGSPYVGLWVPPDVTAQAGVNPYKTDGTVALPTNSVDNGVLTLYVLNPLVSSGSETASISILVSSYSNDMNFWSPDSTKLAYMTTEPIVQPAAVRAGEFEAQSGIVSSDENTPEVENAPEDTSDMDPVGGQKINKSVMAIVAGETVNSFRSLLKRYSLRNIVVTHNAFAIDTYNQVRFGGTIYNPPPSNSDKSIYTLHSYVANCYAGYRGSGRVQLAPLHRGMQVAGTPVRNNAAMRVSRGTGTRRSIAFDSYPISNFVKQVSATDRTWDGVEISNEASGHIVSVEIPFYGGRRYYGNNYDTSDSLGYEAVISYTNGGAGTQSVQECWAEYFAIGEDYNLFFFLGSPVLWKQSV